MAALKSLRWVPCAFPLSNAPASNSNTLPSSQKIQRHAAILSLSRGQAGAQRNAAARAEDRKHALVDSDESDDDLPPVEELLRIPPRPIVSDKASSARPTFQHLDQQALKGVGMQAEQIQSGIYVRQGDSLDQPMILDDDESEEESLEDEAEDGAGDIKTGRTEWDTSQHRALGTSKSASGRTKAIDTSGPWYDVEEGRYIDEPAVRPGPCQPRDVLSAPAQDQTCNLPLVSKPLPNHTNGQHFGNNTLSTLVESAPHSPTPLLNGNDGWTAESIAELEHGMEQALGEQVNSSSNSAPRSPRPHSVEAPQDKINTQERTEELRDASRHGTPAQGLEEWEQRETQVIAKIPAKRELREAELVGEGGGMEMQQQEEVRESSTHPSSHAQPEISLKQPAAPISNGHHHTSPRNESPSSPSSMALCDKTELGDLGEKRGRKDTYREISCESHHSVNGDDIYDTSDENLRPAKRRKPCVAPALIAPLHFRRPRFSVPPLINSFEMDDTQPQASNGYLSNFVDNEQHHTSHSSRNSFTATEEYFAREDEEMDELAMDDYSPKGNDEDDSDNSKDDELDDLAMKECLQQWSNEDGSDNSEDEDYTHDAGNEEEQDARPIKQRKSPLHPHDEAPRHQHPPASILNEQLHTPRPSRSPSATEISELAVEYREWPFQGFLKKVRIGTKTTFSLEFTLDDVPEHPELSAPFKALGKILSTKSPPEAQTSQSTIVSSKRRGTSQPPKKRNPWTEEEDSTLRKMREEDKCSWEEISVALPFHTQGSIQVRYSKNFNNSTGSRKRRRS